MLQAAILNGCCFGSFHKIPSNYHVYLDISPVEGWFFYKTYLLLLLVPSRKATCVNIMLLCQKSPIDQNDRTMLFTDLQYY